MTSPRRPSPSWQVRTTLEVLRGEGVAFDEAWPLAVHGEVCDSYRSARGKPPTKTTTTTHVAPPNLRPSAGQKRCAGCRFAADTASAGRARCTLYGADVFPGVLWPHRTDDRQQWQSALGVAAHSEDDSEQTLSATVRAWRSGYDGLPSRTQAVLAVLRDIAA